MPPGTRMCVNQLSGPAPSTYAEPIPNQSQKTMAMIIRILAIERCHAY